VSKKKKEQWNHI